MINVCIADNFPVVHFGMKAYFKDHPEINIVSNVRNFFMVPDALRNKEIEKIIITRPMVEAGRQLGAMPGDLNQKYEIYMRPIYDNMLRFITQEQIDNYTSSFSKKTEELYEQYKEIDNTHSPERLYQNKIS